MVWKNDLQKAVKNPKNAWQVGKTRLTNLVGKKVYRNTAGFKNNWEGQKTLQKLKKRDTFGESDNPKVIELYNSGFTNLGYPFDPKLLNEIKSKYDKMIEDDKFSYIRSQFEGQVYSRILRRAGDNIPELKELLIPEIIDLIQDYYAGNFKVVNVMGWRNNHVPDDVIQKKELFSSRWHCDGRDTTMIQMFINFSDVTEKDGPFHLQSMERTKELVKMGFKDRRNYGLSEDVMEDPNHVFKHIGKMGSSVIANSTLCFHRAGNPEYGHRRDIIQFRFLPSDKPLSDNLLSDVVYDEPKENSRNMNASDASIT